MSLIIKYACPVSSNIGKNKGNGSRFPKANEEFQILIQAEDPNEQSVPLERSGWRGATALADNHEVR